jgi:hypothetical protein
MGVKLGLSDKRKQTNKWKQGLGEAIIEGGERRMKKMKKTVN